MANISAGGPCQHVDKKFRPKKTYRIFHREWANGREAVAHRCEYCSHVRVGLFQSGKERGVTGWDGPWREWILEGSLQEASRANSKSFWKVFGGVVAVGVLVAVGIIFGLPVWKASTVVLMEPKATIPTKAEYQAEADQMEANLDNYLLSQSQRMAGVYWRIVSASANADRCGAGRDYGIFLSNVAAQHSRDFLRPLYAKVFGADNRHIFFVASDSPAAQAGILEGDDIVAINREPVAADVELVPLYGRLIAAAHRGGDVEIEVVRDGTQITTHVQPVHACQYLYVTTLENVFNADSNGLFVNMRIGVADAGMTDDAIALIVGHEIGHNVLGHNDSLIDNSWLEEFSKMNKMFPSWSRPNNVDMDLLNGHRLLQRVRLHLSVPPPVRYGKKRQVKSMFSRVYVFNGRARG